MHTDSRTVGQADINRKHCWVESRPLDKLSVGYNGGSTLHKITINIIQPPLTSIPNELQQRTGTTKTYLNVIKHRWLHKYVAYEQHNL